MRILFFGMEGVFSLAPLAALLQSEFTVCGVIVPRLNLASGFPAANSTANARPLRPPPRQISDLPMLMPAVERTIIGLAWEASIPVFEVGRLKATDTVTALSALQPDAIVVACFPRLLPRPILDLAAHGAFNIHPSLLPQYRGPEPLFWVFHDGLEYAGVTVHLMDTSADTGAIAAQQAVTLPDGISYADAERICSTVGATLLLDVLRATRDRQLIPIPQNSAAATPAPIPTADDFIIRPDWSPRRASNFRRGLAEWGHPILFKS